MPDKNSNKRAFFLEAYEANADAIFRHCYFRLFNRERAKEIMQDTFMRTWEQIAKGADIKNVKAFLYRIATNLIIDETRKKKTDSLDVLQEKGFNPSFSETETIFNHLEVEQVKHVLLQIDSKYRDVITMRYINDLSVKEISEILHISQNVISVRLHRGLKEVKRLMTYDNEC